MCLNNNCDVPVQKHLAEPDRGPWRAAGTIDVQAIADFDEYICSINQLVVDDPG